MSKPNHRSPTCRLLVKAQHGDPIALNDLIHRIESRLQRFCLFLTGNKEAAADLAQEGYVKILENIHTLKNPEAFTGWLFQVTRNQFLDYVRSAYHKRYCSIENFDEEIFHRAPKSELCLQIVRAMEELTPGDRYLVLLICLEGHTYDEAADLLGLSVESVRSKLYRLRKAVKNHIYINDLPI